jgi:hypothetical protein
MIDEDDFSDDKAELWGDLVLHYEAGKWVLTIPIYREFTASIERLEFDDPSDVFKIYGKGTLVLTTEAEIELMQRGLFDLFTQQKLQSQ